MIKWISDELTLSAHIDDVEVKRADRGIPTVNHSLVTVVKESYQVVMVGVHNTL